MAARGGRSCGRDGQANGGRWADGSKIAGGTRGNKTGVGGGGGDSDSVGDRLAGDPSYFMTDKNIRGCNQSM